MKWFGKLIVEAVVIVVLAGVAVMLIIRWLSDMPIGGGSGGVG